MRHITARRKAERAMKIDGNKGSRALDRNADLMHYIDRHSGGRSSGVEHNLAKFGVVSSNLIARSIETFQVTGLLHEKAGLF